MRRVFSEIVYSTRGAGSPSESVSASSSTTRLASSGRSSVKTPQLIVRPTSSRIRPACPSPQPAQPSSAMPTGPAMPPRLHLAPRTNPRAASVS